MSDPMGYPEPPAPLSERLAGSVSDPDPCPSIHNMDDLLTIEQLVEWLEFSPTSGRKTVRDYMSGRRGTVKLPFVKPGGGSGTKPKFAKNQIAWWLRKTQEQVDPRMVDIRRAQRLLGTKG